MLSVSFCICLDLTEAPVENESSPVTVELILAVSQLTIGALVGLLVPPRAIGVGTIFLVGAIVGFGVRFSVGGEVGSTTGIAVGNELGKNDGCSVGHDEG